MRKIRGVIREGGEGVDECDPFPPPLFYECPLENSMKISKKVYVEETIINNSSNYSSIHAIVCCIEKEGCSIEKVCCKSQNTKQIKSNF